MVLSYCVNGPLHIQKGDVRLDCLCPSFVDTPMLTQDEDFIKKHAVGEHRLMPVQQVADAFLGLVNSQGSGRVAVILKDKPVIHWPNHVTSLILISKASCPRNYTVPYNSFHFGRIYFFFPGLSLDRIWPRLWEPRSLRKACK